MKIKYLFKSERLGFRNWTKNDLPEFAKINADLDVMEHFPKPLTKEDTSAFIERLNLHYEKYGYNYFAVEILKTEELIGFVGLANQDYASDFTPAIAIGWRLKKSAWGKGYAAEGAKKCLEFAFTNLSLNHVISFFTEKNTKSEKVMQKIGMEKIGIFNHPKLKAYPEYQKCVCYKISKHSWSSLD